MEMCNTGYWTPADQALNKIIDLEEENALLEETCYELRLERYHEEISAAKQNPANNVDAMPGYKAWCIGFIGALLGMVVGALIRQVFV